MILPYIPDLSNHSGRDNKHKFMWYKIQCPLYILFGATASAQPDLVYIFEVPFIKLGQMSEQEQARLC